MTQKLWKVLSRKRTFMQVPLFLAPSALLVNGNKEMSFVSMSPHTKFYFHIWAEALSPPPACHISSLGILEITSKSQKRFIFNSSPIIKLWVFYSEWTSISYRNPIKRDKPFSRDVKGEYSWAKKSILESFSEGKAEIAQLGNRGCT